MLQDALSAAVHRLLAPPVLRRQMRYRLPMPVTHVLGVRCQTGFTTYPICPRCELTFEREYQSYCDRCGQHLCWKGFSKAVIVHPKGK